MDINQNLTINTVIISDQLIANKIQIYVHSDSAFINKEEAVKIIKHLVEMFELQDYWRD